ncbi:hypothetical protein F4774DRAFT_260598 [Daldinia eschscholtzii]|nr:hypothetical protein F4774DRAFT_260598 [Daldinia eschscholtzii]
MSTFGSPGSGPYTGKPIPPQRGSFPLDHDGECKAVMTKYLSCIKKVKGVNDEECRNIAKSYLSCRMDRIWALPRKQIRLRVQKHRNGSTYDNGRTNRRLSCGWNIRPG